MSLTSKFTASVKTYVSKHPMLIDENAVTAQRDAECNAIVGAHKPLNAQNWIKHFTVEPWQGSTNMLTIHDAAAASRVPCYFLPYLPDNATTMVLGAAASWFFTSTLTGCTVQVVGPAATPTVTHANARTRYNQEVQNLRPKKGDGSNEHWDDVTDTGKAYVDIVAASRAQTRMNALMPGVPIGQTTGVLRRSEYINKVNYANIDYGKKHFTGQKLNYHLADDVAPSKTTAGKHEVGVFVFGYRQGGLWKFYYQANVQIGGHFDIWRFNKPNKQKFVYGNSIVLGPPTKIFG